MVSTAFHFTFGVSSSVEGSRIHRPGHDIVPETSVAVYDRLHQSEQNGKHVEMEVGAVQYRILLFLASYRFPSPFAEVERVGMLQHVSDLHSAGPFGRPIRHTNS